MEVRVRPCSHERIKRFGIARVLKCVGVDRRPLLFTAEPNMPNRHESAWLAQRPGFDAQDLILTHDLVKQACTAIRAKLTRHLLARWHVANPFFDSTAADLNHRLLDPQCHAKRAACLSLAFRAMARKHRQRYTGNAVVNRTALALTFKNFLTHSRLRSVTVTGYRLAQVQHPQGMGYGFAPICWPRRGLMRRRPLPRSLPPPNDVGKQ